MSSGHRRNDRPSSRSRPFALVLVAVAIVAGCTYSTGDSRPESTGTLGPLRPTTTSTEPAAPTSAKTNKPPRKTPPRRRNQLVLRPTRAATQVIERRNPAALALATSRALIASAPAAVIASAGRRTEERAVRTATALGAPLLLATPAMARAVAAEVGRLGARVVLRVGSLPKALARRLDSRPKVAVVDRLREVPRLRRATANPAGAVLVARGDARARAAIVTARNAGLRRIAVHGGDPRAAADTRRSLHRLSPRRVVAIGPPGAFPSAVVLGGLVRAAASGTELPGGGQLLFPGRRVVALYGRPGDRKHGVLGERPVAGSVRRARRVAAAYRRAGANSVVPAFEMIATLASADAGRDRDFSVESKPDQLRPWIDTAAAAGFLVVLDLRPGRTGFLTQAQRYAALLAQPHVGLALDPRWRLGPRQRHRVHVGRVTASEVNRVAAWLARLTRRHALPQKLLIVHQSRLDMIRHRSRIRAHPELAFVVQMDAHGRQRVKLDTWRAVTAGGPRGVRFGWKHFYDEDTPVRSPAGTLALRPAPVYVSYE